MRDIARQRTVLAITHRLSTVMDMDRVVVMEDGQIVEQGPPHELLARRGRFHQLYALQMGMAPTREEVFA